MTTLMQTMTQTQAEELLAKLPKFKLVPVNDWVVIQKITRGETKTEAGTILPAEAQSSKGMVRAVAEGVTIVAPGDMVVFTGFPQDLSDIEGLTQEKDLYLCRREEVYAKIVPCEP